MRMCHFLELTMELCQITSYSTEIWHCSCFFVKQNGTVKKQQRIPSIVNSRQIYLCYFSVNQTFLNHLRLIFFKTKFPLNIPLRFNFCWVGSEEFKHYKYKMHFWGNFVPKKNWPQMFKNCLIQHAIAKNLLE